MGSIARDSWDTGVIVRASAAQQPGEKLAIGRRKGVACEISTSHPAERWLRRLSRVQRSAGEELKSDQTMLVLMPRGRVAADHGHGQACLFQAFANCGISRRFAPLDVPSGKLPLSKRFQNLTQETPHSRRTGLVSSGAIHRWGRQDGVWLWARAWSVIYHGDDVPTSCSARS